MFNASDEGSDTITDFGTEDMIHFKASAFGVELGQADETSFSSGTTDMFDNSEQFHYNTSTGTLFFDADGTGGSSDPVVMAVLSNKYGLSASNITFVV